MFRFSILVGFRRWAIVLFGMISTGFIFSSSHAKEIHDQNWTLDRIVERALEYSPELKALDKDIVSLQNRAYQAGKWDNPDLAISGGPMFSTPNGTALDATLSQKIPFFGKKAIEEQIGFQAKLIGENDRDIGSLRVQHEVSRLVYRLAAAREESKHIAHRKERIQLISKYLLSRPFASPSQWVEKNLLQNRLREVEERFLDISAERERAWNALNVYLGLNEAIVPDIRWFVDPPEPDYEDLLRKLTCENPELLRQKQLIASADLSIEQAEKRAFPDFQIGLGYNEQTAGVAQRIYSGSIQLSLPIVNRGGYAKEASLAQREAEDYRFEQKRRVLLSAFAQARNDLNISMKRIELFPLKLVPQLEEQMRRTEKEWKKGLVPVVAFLEMENQVHDQAIKVFDAQTAYVAALSQVLLLAGQKFHDEKR